MQNNDIGHYLPAHFDISRIVFAKSIALNSQSSNESFIRWHMAGTSTVRISLESHPSKRCRCSNDFCKIKKSLTEKSAKNLTRLHGDFCTNNITAPIWSSVRFASIHISSSPSSDSAWQSHIDGRFQSLLFVSHRNWAATHVPHPSAPFESIVRTIMKRYSATAGKYYYDEK